MDSKIIKIRILILILFVVTISILSLYGTDVAAELIEYENDDLDFRIQYPDTWEIEDDFGEDSNMIALMPDNIIDKNRYAIVITALDIGISVESLGSKKLAENEIKFKYALDPARYTIIKYDGTDSVMPSPLSHDTITGYGFVVQDNFEQRMLINVHAGIDDTMYKLVYITPMGYVYSDTVQKYTPVFRQVADSIEFITDEQGLFNKE